MSQQQLLDAARKLNEVLDGLDQSQPLLREACTLLRPIINSALAGTLPIPGQLPHRSFFFGMQEDSLPAHYLSETVFMNALGEFDEAWQHTNR
jgi:hypothetical protein